MIESVDKSVFRCNLSTKATIDSRSEWPQ